MTRAAAYQLLGLQPGASDAEIKREYKRLALKLHPDINPSPAANEQFIQLTIALEIALSKNEGLGNKATHKRKSRSTSKTPEPVSQEDLASRMAQAKKRFEQQRVKKEHEENRYYEFLTTGKRWWYFRASMLIGIVLSCCILMDYVLPYHYKDDELLSYSSTDYNGILFSQITAVELKNSGFYYCEVERSSWVNDYPAVKIASTWFLHIPVKFIHHDDFNQHYSYFDFHTGSVTWLLVIVFLIPLVTYFRKKKDLTFAFLYHLSFWGVGILECYFLLSQQRLIHVLTFGFL